MASASEALGMTLPGSSSFPAESQEKHEECTSVGPAMYNLLSQNILPRDIMTRSAFENAMVIQFWLVHMPKLIWILRGPDNDSWWLNKRGSPPDRHGPFCWHQTHH